MHQMIDSVWQEAQKPEGEWKCHCQNIEQEGGGGACSLVTCLSHTTITSK